MISLVKRLLKKCVLWNIFVFPKNWFPLLYLAVKKILLDQKSWLFLDEQSRNQKKTDRVTNRNENWVLWYLCMTVRAFSFYMEKRRKQSKYSAKYYIPSRAKSKAHWLKRLQQTVIKVLMGIFCCFGCFRGFFILQHNIENLTKGSWMGKRDFGAALYLLHHYSSSDFREIHPAWLHLQIAWLKCCAFTNHQNVLWTRKKREV